MDTLNEAQTDILKEVTNVGAGHAATALAQLAGVKISIDVPQIWSAPFETIVERTSQADEPVAVVSMRVLGDLNGQIMFIMRREGAAALLDILLRRAPGTGTITGTMERSGLQETGNILASSFLNALARWMGKILLPSVPTVAIDNREAVVRAVWHGNEEAVLAAETSFSVSQPDGTGARLTGVLVFMLEGPSLEEVLRALARR